MAVIADSEVGCGAIDAGSCPLDDGNIGWQPIVVIVAFLAISKDSGIEHGLDVLIQILNFKRDLSFDHHGYPSSVERLKAFGD